MTINKNNHISKLKISTLKTDNPPKKTLNSDGQQLNSDGQQLNSDGQQLNQYQQNEQLPLT